MAYGYMLKKMEKMIIASYHMHDPVLIRKMIVQTFNEIKKDNDDFLTHVIQIGKALSEQDQ